MEVHQWFWVWVWLAAILFVAEMFTAGFFMLPFGVGAAVAALLEYLGVAVGWQWLAFLSVSSVLVVGLRRFADRVTHNSPEGIGVDRLIGVRGLVTDEVDAHGTTGRVRIGSEDWRAISSQGVVLPAGVPIVVLRIEGTRVVVRAAAADSPEEELAGSV